MLGTVNTFGTLAGNTAGESSLLGRLSENSAAVRRQLDAATAQAGTGRIAESYAGLGAGAGLALGEWISTTPPPL